MASYIKQMQKIVEDYRATEQPWPTSSKTIAAWAIAKRRWEPPPSAALNRCADDIAEAMRQEYFIDAKGRRVRQFHVAQIVQRGEQLRLWDDIRTAPRSHMQLSFQQKRRGIFWDCHQLKTECDSYNDSHPDELPIQMVFDFTVDLAEYDAAEQDEDDAA